MRRRNRNNQFGVACLSHRVAFKLIEKAFRRLNDASRARGRQNTGRNCKRMSGRSSSFSGTLRCTLTYFTVFRCSLPNYVFYSASYFRDCLCLARSTSERLLIKLQLNTRRDGKNRREKSSIPLVVIEFGAGSRAVSYRHWHNHGGRRTLTCTRFFDDTPCIPRDGSLGARLGRVASPRREIFTRFTAFWIYPRFLVSRGKCLFYHFTQRGTLPCVILEARVYFPSVHDRRNILASFMR